MRNVRGKQISLVPQSAALALNGALRIRTQLREAWKAHSKTPWDVELPRIRGLLRSCGVPDEDAFLDRYPDQISLGQAQRVLIVMAVLHGPELVIADEPTSALDVVTQIEVLQLLKEFNQRQRMSILLISHDLAVVAAICHRILILAEGAIVESGIVEKVFTSPSHPYTQALVSAAKRLQYGYLQFDRDLPYNQGS
jgi:ABC-type dipeptide/oligopeptide/nickel transport system ATPase component